MALRKSLILRKLRSSCLEGRTARILPIMISYTGEGRDPLLAWAPAPCSLPGAGFAGVAEFLVAASVRRPQ
jgi:hypothetical protein